MVMAPLRMRSPIKILGLATAIFNFAVVETVLVTSLVVPTYAAGDADLICGTQSTVAGAFDLIEGTGGLFFRAGTDLNEFFRITNDTQNSLRRFAAVLAARQVTLVMLPLPTRGIVQSSHLRLSEEKQGNYDVGFARSEFEAYIGQLRGAGIKTVDLLDWIDSDGTNENFFYLRDHHWTTTGAHEAAKAVAALLQDVPAYQAMTKTSFETEDAGEVDHKTTMALDIERACGTQVPAEVDRDFVTTQQIGSSDELFGSAAETPAAALVGSSFSATSEFHFDDFLSQETGLPIANYAINGAEFVGSLATLVFSKTFVHAPPSIIIWEAPSYYLIDGDVFSSFRQITAAVYGPCALDATIATSGTFALDGEQQMLTLSPEAAITSRNYYAVVESSQRGTTGLNMSIGYANGDKDTVSLGGFERFVDDGNFYLELNDEIDAAATSVSIEGHTGTAQVKVSICAVPEIFRSL